MTLIALERHPLGPRLHVVGRRVHECHVGLALAGVAVVSMLETGPGPRRAAFGLVAAWPVVKHWRDLHPATRDTAAWSLGLHRRPEGR